MTATPETGSTTEATILLENPLLAVDDESCIFDSIPEPPEDIVDWFDKSEEHILNTDNLIGNKPDPLLIQVDTRDSPILLHVNNDSDGDALQEMCMSMLNSSESEYFKQSVTTDKKDKNMNTTNTKNNEKKKRNKCDLLNDIGKCGLTIEVTNSNKKLEVRLRNKLGYDVFPIHYVPLNESGHVNKAIVKQPVKLVEKVRISSQVIAEMLCVHSKLGLRIWFCPNYECHRAFYRYDSAKLHALKHLDYKPFKCDFPNCEWSFFTSCKLKRHQETHSKRKDFICPYPDCDRRFTTIYNLNSHCRRCHEKPATLPCLVKGCDKYFKTGRARELHLKAHGKAEAPYRCPVGDCDKKFFLFTALSTHARVHSHKESELKCQWPNCGRKFEQPCRLKQHQLQHTGQRPFICTFDKCKWAFSTASKLKRHLSTHTNERKFHCTMGSCNKSFLRPEHLREHTLTHIGQRPFHCDECDATFVGKSGLFLHLKKAHQKTETACARAVPFKQNTPSKLSANDLLEQAVQSLDIPSNMILGTGLLPEEPLELLNNASFSTVNLRDLQ